MSSRTLRRHIIAERGVSARAWLDTLRLRKGAALLAFERLPIKVVAFELGFKQPSHFSTKFKLEFGLSPRQFQRQPRKRPPAKASGSVVLPEGFLHARGRVALRPNGPSERKPRSV